MLSEPPDPFKLLWVRSRRNRGALLSNSPPPVMGRNSTRESGSGGGRGGEGRTTLCLLAGIQILVCASELVFCLVWRSLSHSDNT